MVVIGNFDGVHRGHRALLSAAAEGRTEPLVVCTFWPHPLAVLRPDAAPLLITDLDTRIQLLRDAGAAEVRVVPFSEEVSKLSPEEFVERFLLPLHPVRVAVGRNFRFGHRAAGGVDDLERLAAGRFEVLTLDLTEVDGDVTCSTLVRDALDDGNVEAAAQHLGRAFEVSGVVVVGDQRGRELGFPTANLPVPPRMAVPADGVYAGWLVDESGTRYPAAISVGTNPTFDGSERRVETYAIGQTDLKLYGTRITVEFVGRIRGQVAFSSIDGLTAQMDDDVRRAVEVLGESPVS